MSWYTGSFGFDNGLKYIPAETRELLISHPHRGCTPQSSRCTPQIRPTVGVYTVPTSQVSITTSIASIWGRHYHIIIMRRPQHSWSRTRLFVWTWTTQHVKSACMEVMSRILWAVNDVVYYQDTLVTVHAASSRRSSCVRCPWRWGGRAGVVLVPSSRRFTDMAGQSHVRDCRPSMELVEIWTYTCVNIMTFVFFTGDCGSRGYGI